MGKKIRQRGTLEFLKPSLGKIVITLFLLVLTSFFISSPFKYFYGLDHSAQLRGFPLLVFEELNLSGTWGSSTFFQISWTGLVINLVFWYLISCLIIFWRKKK